MIRIMRTLFFLVLLSGGLGAMENRDAGKKREKLSSADRVKSENYWKCLPVELDPLILSFVIGQQNPIKALKAQKNFKLISRRYFQTAQSSLVLSQIARSGQNQKESLKVLIKAIYAQDLGVAQAFIDERPDLLEGTAQFIPDRITTNCAIAYLDRTPFAAAAESGNRQLCELLIGKNVQIDRKDRYDNTPLILAVKNRQPSTVSLLIANKAHLIDKDKKDLTSLMHAIIVGEQESVQLLIHAGAVKSSNNCAQSQKFLIDTLLQRLEAVEAALSQEINVDTPDLDGTTPLMFACMSGNTALVELFLRYNASVHACSNYFWTPLMFAAYAGHKHIVALLINNQADTSVGNALECPLSLAAGEGHSCLVELLLNTSSIQQLRTALMSAVQNGHNKVIQLLFDNSAELDTPANWGEALHCAAANGHTSLVKNLLDRGALVDYGDAFNHTPLACASLFGYTTTVLTLLEHGASVNIPNCIGYTPLMLATINGHEHTVRLLLPTAQLDVRSAKGETALDLALDNRHFEIADLLASPLDMTD